MHFWKWFRIVGAVLVVGMCILLASFTQNSQQVEQKAPQSMFRK